MILALIATFDAYETTGLLIGAAASPTVVRNLRQIIRETEGVAHINELRTIHLGPNDILAAISVDFDDGITSEAVEDAVTAMEKEIKARHPRVTRVFIEIQSKDASRAAARAARKATT